MFRAFADFIFIKEKKKKIQSDSSLNEHEVKKKKEKMKKEDVENKINCENVEAIVAHARTFCISQRINLLSFDLAWVAAVNVSSEQRSRSNIVSSRELSMITKNRVPLPIESIEMNIYHFSNGGHIANRQRTIHVIVAASSMKLKYEKRQLAILIHTSKIHRLI